MDIRNLKKQIRLSCSNMALECLFAIENVEGINVEAMQNVIDKIAVLQASTLKRCNFHFDKGYKSFDSVHAYRRARREYFHTAYHTLVDDYNKQVDEIVNDMNAAMPKAQAEA